MCDMGMPCGDPKCHYNQGTFGGKPDPKIVVIPKGDDPRNPKDIIGETKVPLWLIPPASSIYEALALGNGAKKYGPFNWREMMIQYSVYHSAIRRHLDAFLDGEDFAADSGLHHLAHAKAGLGIVIDALENGMLIDDRPVKGSCAALLERSQQTAVATPAPSTLVPETPACYGCVDGGCELCGPPPGPAETYVVEDLLSGLPKTLRRCGCDGDPRCARCTA